MKHSSRFRRCCLESRRGYSNICSIVSRLLPQPPVEIGRNSKPSTVQKTPHHSHLANTGQAACEGTFGRYPTRPASGGSG